MTTWKRVVVNLVGDAVHGRLAESRFVERPFLYGGEHCMYEVAFAAAALGHEVELRGWLHRPSFDELAAGAGVSPRVGLEARAPAADDLVLVPEGWIDPLEYARLVLSPAQLVLYLLAAPGLFGWPFVAEPWERPDPLTVPVGELARREHFQGMAALGFRLITHSPGLAEAATAAGVTCAVVGTGRPGWQPQPPADKPVDVLALQDNRWTPLAERVLAELGDLVTDRVETVSNAEMLARMAQAKVLVWPSRIEGHATIPWEARSVGCVPVALSSNQFAVGLDEAHGALLVDEIEELAPAMRALLTDRERWERLSKLGRETAPAEVRWEPYVDRVRLFLEGPLPEDPARAPLAGIGNALTGWLDMRAAEAQARLEEKNIEVIVAGRELQAATENQARLMRELDDLLARRSVRAAISISDRVRSNQSIGRLRRASSRLGGIRSRPSSQDPWTTYMAEVEPALSQYPRVHRFAQVPVIGPAELPSEPLAVWIEDGEEDRAQRTRASLAPGSAVPFETLGGSLRDALASTRCERVVLIRAGDTLSPSALKRLGQAATLAPDAAVITCDDDLLRADGGRDSPHFRPGPSPDRWLACDDSGPLLVVSREQTLRAMPAATEEPSWRHQLALALARSGSSGHAHVPMLLCHRSQEVAEQPGVAPAWVEWLLGRWGETASVTSVDGVRRVRRPLAHEPLVEVIVCFRDTPDLLARCLRSLLERTDYDRLRVALVDNGSVEPQTQTLLDRARRDHRVRVLRDERPFNFAALNNAAARSSASDVLVFLNNDTEVIQPDWLEPLLEEALRPEIGAVAPLLLYPDGTVQHAGAALGLHGYAGHPFAGLDPATVTPFGHAQEGTRNWLAVTAACMALERRKFDDAGGFDESFVVAGNDVDLCLRLTAAGHRSLCVPHVRLIHDESRSRGAHIDPQDFVRSEQRYGEFRSVGDPFYNPNLTLSRTDCSVRLPGEGFS